MSEELGAGGRHGRAWRRDLGVAWWRAEGKRSVIAPRAAEVISAYVASAGQVVRGPPTPCGAGRCTYPAGASPPRPAVRPALR